MSRIFLQLSSHATIAQNKHFTREVCREGLEDFKYFIEKFPHNSINREPDESTSLSKFLSNIHKGYHAKLALGSLGEGHPMMIEGCVFGVYLPQNTEEKMLNWFCPWTEPNYERINEIFIHVYKKPIFSFPRMK